MTDPNREPICTPKLLAVAVDALRENGRIAWTARPKLSAADVREIMRHLEACERIYAAAEDRATAAAKGGAP